MFKQAGQFEGKVVETMLAEPRFAKDDPNAFDVCLKIEGPAHQGVPQVGWWSGEMSGKYGRGNLSSKTQAQITMDALHGVGFEGNDLTTLDTQLKGKTIPFTVESREYNEKTYYDIKYIGGGSWAPKAIDKTAVAARMAVLMNSSARQPAPAVAAAAKTDKDDVPW